MKYRDDIDGLRAIAVIAVILFHLRVAPFTGGFVGVDVFFVISGFLITGLLLNDIRNDRFSIAHFYERRVRRILPALFTVLVVTALGCCVLLPPDALRDFGNSVATTVLFSSNILFWKEAGYFKPAAEMKPLLHTWSLAVEEQFYIVYPLFLWVVARFFRKRYTWALLAAFCLSFALSLWGVHHDKTAAFYLAPSRAWELVIGGFLAVELFPPLRNRIAAEALSTAGLLLTLFGFIDLSRNSIFPGFNALYPTVGAALIIYTGAPTTTWVSKLLRWRPVVFIGLISYSLYLWHWVVITLFKYWVVRRLTPWDLVGIAAVSVALASLSWYFVENPFRGREGLIRSRRILFATAAAAALPILLFAFVSRITKGLPGRFSAEAKGMLAAKEDYWKRRPDCAGRICKIGDPNATPQFVLWGDSHAGALAPELETLAIANHTAGLVAFNPTCAPLLDLKHYADAQPGYCAQFNASVLEHIKKAGITTVLLHARWALSAEGLRYKEEPGDPMLLAASRDPADNFQEFAADFRATVSALRRLKLDVTIIAGVPEIGYDVPTMLARDSGRASHLNFAPLRSEFMERQARTLKLLQQIAAEQQIRIIYPDLILCADARCLLEVSNHPLYIDDNHLSTYGAMQLAPELSPLLQEAAHRAPASHNLLVSSNSP